MEGVLSKALALEKKYDWLEARDLYEQVLGLVDERDFLTRAELQERIGYCLHRAAFQAKSQEEFRQRLGLAVEAYEKACGSYEKLVDKDNEARMFRCRAISKYVEHWIKSAPSEKRVLLDECLELEKNALTAFSGLGQTLEYVRTYNELPLVFQHRFNREWDVSLAKQILEKGITWGEEAVRGLSEVGDSYEAARTHFALATCLEMFRDFIPEPEKQEHNVSRTVEHLHKASEFSERVGDAYLSGLIHLWSAMESGGEERMSHLNKALECAEEMHDMFLKAYTLDYLAYSIWRRGFAAEDPDRKRIMFEQAMELYDKAQLLFSVISLTSPRGGTIRAPGGHAEIDYYFALLETAREKRMELLERSEKAGLEALKVAEESDIPEAMLHAIHVLSKTLTEQALLVPNIDAKRSLLERAVELRKSIIEQTERLRPFDYHDRGTFYGHFANIKAGLADIQLDLESRKRLLEEAVLWQEKGIDSQSKARLLYERMGQTEMSAGLMGRQYSCGVLLNELFKVTDNPEHLRRAIETWQKAIETARKLDSVILIAESCWRIAQAQNALGEPSEAAESFQRASESYTRAAEKIPQLKDFYQDYASYMQAWSEIEKARRLHAERDYRLAREHYEKAAELHKATVQWNHLYQNYNAWARLEEAEDQSRREQTQQARDLFQQGATLFAEAKESIKKRLDKIDTEEERQFTQGLIKTSDLRREYCFGRAALEEAKLLDKQGDHVASSKKYGLASKSFEKVVDAMEDEFERRELASIAYLCQAWEKMTGAEAEASPELYLEASGLFDKAKEYTVDEKAKILALGHGNFCRALEAGAMYERTQDEQFYSAAKRHVETATNFYVRAGFKEASEYAKATNRLFDAYRYMYRAQLEDDLAKKAQLYQLAEKLLQTSAGFYITAKHPEKSDEILRVLESVRQEKETALSLTEVLHAPAITSTTNSFSTPSQTREQAVGLERFENADIQANLMPHDQEVKIGGTIRIRIDLVNAGRGGAQLIKVAELLPQSFELVEKPEMYNVEDSGLNMKGKSLAPLRTEELNLVLKPLDKGTYQIKPRILYLDEAGKYKSHEPEPATITVKELGISGWLKGPTRDKQSHTRVDRVDHCL